ncbi:YceH family protein [Arenicella xantha]|uniref:Uncharacterized protein n=1 Tax=Arenicella xantha TaxID=644221 RepID=A0A395JLT7_9GAMM|nr:DUF480 domain-containing protein [Arenicella xantha]RBP51753.1 hypothetical protein DFR28_1021186 [Arenicella xantha]
MIENQLTVHQARVFACLMEKHLATPNNYPLTINSLVLACNQKSNREPVMSLTEGQVGHVVGELVALNLARIDYGDRANKITHRGPGELKIDRHGQAVMAMLMLRAPLTLAEIKARTDRMVEFDDLDAVSVVVEDLMQREQPLVMLIPKGPGRREDRYTHLLCGEPDLTQLDKVATPAKVPNSDKLAELEARIEQLERALEKLS